MNSFLLAAITTILFAACTNTKKEQGNRAETTTTDTAVISNKLAQVNLNTNTYEEVDSSGIFILPLSMEETVQRGATKYYKEMPAGRYWNIVFYNSLTGSTHLLGSQKMLITRYDVSPGGMPDGRTHPKLIFYTMVTNDANGDKLLNEADPVYLFSSNKEGKQLKQLSPNGYHVKTWRYIKPSEKVLMLAMRDSDDNHEFNNKDEVSAFETKLDSAAQPREIIAPELKTQIKELFHRDWKRLKNQ